jgi:ketopantoate reductase
MAKKNICLIGGGGVGTIAAYVLERSQHASVTLILRSNYAAVNKNGYDIESVDHGTVKGWKPSKGMTTTP